jgi:hypothetical protein
MSDAFGNGVLFKLLNNGLCSETRMQRKGKMNADKRNASEGCVYAP